MMPLYVYILADLEVDFKRFFLLCLNFFFRYLVKRKCLCYTLIASTLTIFEVISWTMN